ncbi:MAG: PilZ domain-containing protein [Rhodospirillaceae bacterium]
MPENSAAKARPTRQAERQAVSDCVEVNGGKPFRGGTLRDISATGAAVSYPTDAKPFDLP